MVLILTCKHGRSHGCYTFWQAPVLVPFDMLVISHSEYIVAFRPAEKVLLLHEICYRLELYTSKWNERTRPLKSKEYVFSFKTRKVKTTLKERHKIPIRIRLWIGFAFLEKANTAIWYNLARCASPHFRTLYTYFELEECFPDSIGSCVIRIILCEMICHALIERTTQFLSQSSNAHIDMKCSRTCSEVKVLRVFASPSNKLNRSQQTNRLLFQQTCQMRCLLATLATLLQRGASGKHAGARPWPSPWVWFLLGP